MKYSLNILKEIIVENFSNFIKTYEPTYLNV